MIVWEDFCEFKFVIVDRDNDEFFLGKKKKEKKW